MRTDSAPTLTIRPYPRSRIEDPLAGRVAVVTGGATGIGRAISERLAADGAAVVVAGLGQDEVDTAVGELRGADRRAAGFVGDLAAPDGAAAMAELARTTFGPADVLVNSYCFRR